MKLVVTNAARAEERDAARWYEKEGRDLPRRFRKEVKKTLQRVRSTPQQFPFVDECHQRALVDVFPYALFFEHTEDAILVVALVHLSREPFYWRA